MKNIITITKTDKGIHLQCNEMIVADALLMLQGATMQFIKDIEGVENQITTYEILTREYSRIIKQLKNEN